MVNKELLQPNLVLSGSIIELSNEILELYHIKGLILDVDDTLLPLSGMDIPPEITTWLATIREKVVIWLVSNNISHNRISRIGNTLQLPYLLGAIKPSRRKLKQALDCMGLKPEEVAMVGDRIFTDVLAGNRLGMFTILVQPMTYSDQKNHPLDLRGIEIWLFDLLGLPFPTPQQNFTKQDKSSQI